MGFAGGWRAHAGTCRQLHRLGPHGCGVAGATAGAPLHCCPQNWHSVSAMRAAGAVPAAPALCGTSSVGKAGSRFCSGSTRTTRRDCPGRAFLRSAQRALRPRPLVPVVRPLQAPCHGGRQGPAAIAVPSAPHPRSIFCMVCWRGHPATLPSGRWPSLNHECSVRGAPRAGLTKCTGARGQETLARVCMGDRLLWATPTNGALPAAPSLNGNSSPTARKSRTSPRARTSSWVLVAGLRGTIPTGCAHQQWSLAARRQSGGRTPSASRQLAFAHMGLNPEGLYVARMRCPRQVYLACTSLQSVGEGGSPYGGLGGVSSCACSHGPEYIGEHYHSAQLYDKGCRY